MCLFLGAVDHGFGPWWSKTKENKIDISSPLRVRARLVGWESDNMSSGAT
jgi:hypothetical protein